MVLVHGSELQRYTLVLFMNKVKIQGAEHDRFKDKSIK